MSDKEGVALRNIVIIAFSLYNIISFFRAVRLICQIKREWPDSHTD